MPHTWSYASKQIQKSTMALFTLSNCIYMSMYMERERAWMFTYRRKYLAPFNFRGILCDSNTNAAKMPLLSRFVWGWENTWKSELDFSASNWVCFLFFFSSARQVSTVCKMRWKFIISTLSPPSSFRCCSIVSLSLDASPFATIHNISIIVFVHYTRMAGRWYIFFHGIRIAFPLYDFSHNLLHACR